jgi:hypothetical protein
MKEKVHNHLFFFAAATKTNSGLSQPASWLVVERIKATTAIPNKNE